VRDWLIVFFVLAVLPYALRHTFVAVLMWFWAGLVGLSALGYDMARSLAIVQLFAVIALVSMFARKEHLAIGPTYRGFPKLLTLMVVHGFLAAALAYPGMENNWYLYSNVLKTAILCIILPSFLNDRARLNLLVLGIGVGMGYHGLLDGLKFFASGGGHHAVGIEKFGDNNHYGMMLAMNIPLLVYLYRYAKEKLIRIACVGGLLLNGAAVIATNSRGALVTVVLMTLWMLMFSKRKISGLIIVAALAVAGAKVAPDAWFDRMNTLQAADQDDSFMGRVTAWKRASAIAMENPMFGGGYHAGQSMVIFEKFRYKQGFLGFVETPNVDRPAASHSIYFEAVGDLGFLGLFIFLACMLSTFYYWLRILGAAKKRPVELEWARNLSVALAASMVAYLVGGAALSVAYYEMPYYIVTAMFSLFLITERTLAPAARGREAATLSARQVR
jgi:probable O-glycosylation ligase (exosortase A-associated)